MAPSDVNETNRDRLLLKMYDQLFADINRHIIVVWQSVGVLVGTFAVLALVEKQIISLDTGAALLILMCGWLLANLLDSGYWYNRNLVMIANIERQFLLLSDAREIHYYFTAHRPNNKMITHLRIQAYLGFSIAAIVCAFHFLDRIAPGFGSPWSNFQLQRALPYVLVVGIAIYLDRLRKHRDRGYTEFLRNSPGKPVDTAGIAFGEGHGFPRPKESEAPPPSDSAG